MIFSYHLVSSLYSVDSGLVVLHECCLSVSEAQENPEKFRFEIELEFVQCLGNPSYLNCEGNTS